MKSCCKESCDCAAADKKPRGRTWVLALCGAAALVLVLQAVLG